MANPTSLQYGIIQENTFSRKITYFAILRKYPTYFAISCYIFRSFEKFRGRLGCQPHVYSGKFFFPPARHHFSGKGWSASQGISDCCVKGAPQVAYYRDAEINPDVQKACKAFRGRIEQVIAAGGGHIE